MFVVPSIGDNSGFKAIASFLIEIHAYFTRETKFCDIQLVSMDNLTFQKWGLLLQEKHLPQEEHILS